jgi:threonine aldolase
MDGARFANAMAFLGVPARQVTWEAGIDVLSFGASKGGCMAAEAVVFFDPALAENFGYRRMRAGHLVSKMRFISAQLETYLTDGLWLKLARHANAMAQRLAQGLATVPGVRMMHSVEVNEVFLQMPQPIIAGLRQAGFAFYDWPAPPEEAGPAIRLVTAFNTEAADVELFLKTARQLSARPA